jgi:hypothetical protein
MKMPKSWIAELLVDFWRAMVGFFLWIDPDMDLTGTRPTSQIPWYVSFIFCVVGTVILLGGWLWFFWLFSR